MTLASTLITEIRGYLRDGTDNSGSYMVSDSEILGYINRSIDELCLDTDINIRTYEKTYNAAAIAALSSSSVIPFTNITGGTESYLFELKGVWRLNAGTDNYNWCDLRTTDALENALLGSESTLIAAEVYDDSLYLNIAIPTDTVLRITGRWKKTTLTATTDTYPLNVAAESATVAYAVAMGFYKKSQFEAGDRWILQWQDRKNKVANLIKKNRGFSLPGGISLVKKNIDVIGGDFLRGRSIPSA